MGALLKAVTVKSALAFGVLVLISNTVQAQGELPPATPAMQPPQEVGTGSGQTLEYARDTTVANNPALAAPVPVVPQVAPPAAPAPAVTAPVITEQKVAETPAAKKPYIEIDLDLLREKMDRPRKSQWGGAGGFTPQVIMLDMDPVMQLAATDPFLKDKSFNFNESSVLLWGGMGYGGVGNGIRIGGGGWGGYSTFYSGSFRDSGAAKDSIVELITVPAYGCMIIEKAFTLDRLNIIVGGSMGAGALVVFRNVYATDEYSAFNSSGDSTFTDADANVAVAPVSVLGLHAGATYSLIDWLHLGADAGITMFHSGRGFGYGFGSFTTYNPAIRMRIIFGNLG